jgi:hypothetical protein
LEETLGTYQIGDGSVEILEVQEEGILLLEYLVKILQLDRLQRLPVLSISKLYSARANNSRIRMLEGESFHLIDGPGACVLGEGVMVEPADTSQLSWLERVPIDSQADCWVSVHFLRPTKGPMGIAVDGNHVELVLQTIRNLLVG